MSKLVLAEKPSVAVDIARVLGAKNRKNGFIEGNGYIVTWCIGHLVGLCYPDVYNHEYKEWKLETLPIIPEKMKTEVLKDTKNQFEIVKRLLNDSKIKEVICATDAAREGEYIFGLIYDKAKCNKPVKRLWISSMTDEAIAEGFKKLKNRSEYINLYESARCRAEADWLVGLNATRLYSVKHNNKLSIGRVQTPTLAILVERYKEIVNFVPEKYFEIEADYNNFKGLWKNEKGSKISDENIALEIINKVKNKPGIVEDVINEDKSKANPLLYDLTELQREANKKFGYTAKNTLSAAQSLYEKHKLITYPRTDSRYLSTDMIPTLKEILINISNAKLSKHIALILSEELNITNRIVDNSKISDHHAIIPTNKTPSLKELNEAERNIYDLISTRFVSAFLPKYEYQETTVTINIENEKFISKGKTIKQLGWLELEGKTDDENIEQLLPYLEINQTIEVKQVNKLEKFTKPKKHHTEASLLSAMENIGHSIDDEELKEQIKDKGIGTPATRSSIIERLIDVGYVSREKKNLIPTEKGIQLIEILPNALKSPVTTAEWEYQLNQISKGSKKADEFMNDIKMMVKELVSEVIKGDSIEFKNTKVLEKEIIGICPRCNKNIYENAKAFYCEGYNAEPKCSFSMWKEDKFFKDRGKKLTKTMAKQLLKNGTTLVKGFKKKDGTGTYDANVVLKDTGKYVNYELNFDK